jgi:hypothetical protein
MPSWMKKTGHVVADEVEVALVGVELGGEAPRTSRTVSAEPREPTTVENRTNTGSRTPFRIVEEAGLGDVGERLVDLEVAVGAGAAGVDDALGDALVVEVRDLLAEVEVFQAGWGRAHRP